MRKHSAFLSSIYGYINAFVISFGSHVRFVMVVLVTVFYYNGDAAKSFPGNFREKQAKM